MNQRVPVISEAIAAVQYNDATNGLVIEFRDDTQTTHYGVSEKVYREFMDSPNKGGYYNQNIGPIFNSSPAVEWQGVQMVPVESSLFNAVYYDESSSVLSMMGDGGDVTQYQRVPAEIYHGFIDASIKGSYFAGYIKDYYDT
ncbi:MAG: KTSC domain-containing protein, partial [Verrucomicrobiota bacterium]